MTLRWDAPDSAALRRALTAPELSAAGGTLTPSRAHYFRDVYFDTSAGDLRRRDARCRVRFAAGMDHTLTVWLPGGRRLAARVRAADPGAALNGDSPPAAALRALTDPARLRPWIEREVERTHRSLELPILRVPLCDVVGDAITLRRGDLTTTLHELSLRPRFWGRSTAARLAQSLEPLALRPAGSDSLQRAVAALDLAEAEGIGRELRGEREVALVAVEHGRVGLRHAGVELRLPVSRGSGEAACRAALRELFGSGEGQLRLLGVVPRSGDRVPLEVWTVRRQRASNGGSIQWFTPADLVARVGSPILRDPGTLAALTVAARSPLIPEWSGAAFGGDAEVDVDTPHAVVRASRVTLSELRTPALTDEAKDPARAAPEQFLNPVLSWLEFNSRVLALAEDPGTPLAARVRFLSIFSTNLDQFVMTQIGALKQLVASGRNSPSADAGGLKPQETLDAFGVRLRPLLTRQYRAFQSLGEHLQIASWDELGPDERAALRARCADQILPFVGLKALTRAPGHPFPLVRDRRIALLVTLRDHPGAPVHYAIIEIPDDAPRFLRTDSRVARTEDVIRANLDLLYPGRVIGGAHAFRLTRSGDLQLDESATANFLQAIEEELARGEQRPVLRIEFEAGTPPALQDLLQRELRFEESERESTLNPADVYVSDGMIDLGGLRRLPALTALPDYPRLAPSKPFRDDQRIADQIEAGDVLVYHPYDSFPDSFERFIVEAADDPDVRAIKLTLYRPGGPSAIADALRRAARLGKDVSVVVELKARFDEARNISWARSLEQDGIHVVTGLVSLKTHAKLALVVRQSPAGVRRHAHIGSGNYNAETARGYTDVGLFTADPRITGDLHALFNELTGSSHAPRLQLLHLLVAPASLLDRLLALIEREAAHARAGRPARIRAKLNALADSSVIQALYRASQSGVEIDLVVRGICTLRPGVPGLSDRIRVTSVLGRFLEHARIYHFANGGQEGEYFIGSADWRPRNLRRRVEVMVPVYDPALQGRLNEILDADLGGRQDSTIVWRLSADGSYKKAAV
ncbi:MAG TPA: polyphosphate kinase 1 [Gemmatimonadales bacterium]|nr:polyphosphate kinase 1 [Gemmatimonadales bacterium]